MINFLFLAVLTLTATTTCAQENFEEIAYRYAPIIYTNNDVPGDWITRMDYDGDWDLTNNASKERLTSKEFDAKNDVHIYYDVIETTNYYLISYMVYHPIDGKIENGHSHDSESVFVLAKKSPEHDTNIVFFATNVHGLAYNVSGAERYRLGQEITLPEFDFLSLSYIKSEVYKSIFVDGLGWPLPQKISANDVSSLNSFKYFYGNNPIVYSVPVSHAIYPLNKDSILVGALHKYVPHYRVKDTKKETGYDLVSLSKIILEHGIADTSKQPLEIRVEKERESQIYYNKNYDKSKEANSVAENDYYIYEIDKNFSKYFNNKFFSNKKGVMTIVNLNGEDLHEATIIPTHFAQSPGEDMPEADLPLHFSNGGINMMAEPIRFLRSIGLKDEDLKYNPYMNFPYLYFFSRITSGIKIIHQ